MQQKTRDDPDLPAAGILVAGGPRSPRREPEPDDAPTPSRVPMDEPDEGDPVIDPSVREPPMLPGERPVILPPD